MLVSLQLDGLLILSDTSLLSSPSSSSFFSSSFYSPLPLPTHPNPPHPQEPPICSSYPIPPPSKTNCQFIFILHQWRRKLENFEGNGDGKKMGFRGTPSETHQFWPVCLLSLDNFAILFLTFLVFIFLYNFLPAQNFRGDVRPSH